MRSVQTGNSLCKGRETLATELRADHLRRKRTYHCLGNASHGTRGCRPRSDLTQSSCEDALSFSQRYSPGREHSPLPVFTTPEKNEMGARETARKGVWGMYSDLTRAWHRQLKLACSLRAGTGRCTARLTERRIVHR